jgi:hypothetical protein
MKAYRRVDICRSTCSWPGHYCRWVVSFMPRPLYPGERVLFTHWIWGWVGFRTVLDGVERGKKSYHYRDSKSDPSVVQPVASRCTDCAIPATQSVQTSANSNSWTCTFLLGAISPQLTYRYLVTGFYNPPAMTSEMIFGVTKFNTKLLYRTIKM